MAHLKYLSRSLQLVGGTVAFVLFSLTFVQAKAVRSTHLRYIPTQPASVYTYDGAIYDRLFAQLSGPRFLRSAVRRTPNATSHISGAPRYTIVNLEEQLYEHSGFSTAGYPTAVNSSGRITYYGLCFCDSTGTYGNLGYVIDDVGHLDAELLPVCCPSPSNQPDVIPYAINTAGISAGSYTSNGGNDFLTGYVTWMASGTFLSYDPYGEARPGSFALALNDDSVSVGQSPCGGVPTAASFSNAPGPASLITCLLPPKNTSWIGTATGINSSGIIVGYGIFKNQSVGRALRFYRNGYAGVLPVGARGVSTSAQAINVRGDVVGNAGSQAYIYKNNRVTYLPRPANETAGDAVAYAINTNDEVVGDIITSSGKTAFLYVDGRSYDLNSLLPANSGWDIQGAAGINDSGQIVGTGNLGSYSMKVQSSATASTLHAWR